MAARTALLVLALSCAGVVGSPSQNPPLGKEEWPKLLHTLEGFSYGLAFSPDGKTLAAGGRDGGIRPDRDVVLWDVATGKQSGALGGHRDVRALAFNPDGKLLASAGEGIRVWDVATGKPVASAKGHRGLVRAVAFSPDSKLLATGAGWDPKFGNTVGLWEVGTLKSAATVPEYTSGVLNVVFSLDGKTLAFAGEGAGDIRLWGVDTGKDRLTIDVGRDPGDAPGLVAVHCLTFSPDGKTLGGTVQYPFPRSPAPAGGRVGPPVDPRDVTLWDAATGKPAVTLAGHERQVGWVAFSPDGKLLASASSDRTVRLWDLAAKKQVATLEVKAPQKQGPRPWPTRVAFSPDGKVLAVASGSGNVINLWSLERGK